MTGLDVTAYRTAAGDALRAAQSVQRELASLDPDEAIREIEARRRIARLFPPRDDTENQVEALRRFARGSIHMAAAAMYEARLLEQEAGQ